MTSQPSQNDGDMQRPVHLSDDELSAYINSEITQPFELERFQAHLDECAECRERLADTRTVVSLLNRVEVPPTPRSFKLDPSTVKPRAVAIDPWIVRVQPAMRRLTAIAAALLLIVVMADVISHQGQGAGTPSAALDAATSMQTSAESAAAPVTNSSAGESKAAGSEATPAASAAALAAPESREASTPQASVSQSTAERPSAAEPVGSASTSRGPNASYWRLSELAVGVIVVWLLFLTIALPRLQSRREA